MKKLFALMLTLVLVCGLLPGTAAASSLQTNNNIPHDILINNSPILNDSTTLNQNIILNNSPNINLDISLNNGQNSSIAGSDDSLTIESDGSISIAPGIAPGIVWEDDEAIPVHNSINDHEKLFWNSNTKYHWKQCACGARLGEELHVDPKDADDDTCICGYRFSDNADLVTLWVRGCPGIKYFNKNKTEYELDAYTYKDVKEIKISTRTHDSEATVELPEDLTLKEGKNTFEVKVTSENQKVTKIYTLIINKEAKK